MARHSARSTNRATNQRSIRFIDLFCGIGGFRYAIEQAAKDRQLQPECVLSSDIDPFCQTAYEANFGHRPHGDITKIAAEDVPEHNLLLAGFPCQPFSICGDQKGFEDTRGTLFFDIARIIAAKRPDAFVLENVKMLRGHDNGRTLRRIMQALENLEYQVSWKVLNALDFGVPQKRERIFIVGFKDPKSFAWPTGGIPMKPLRKILQSTVPSSFFASQKIRKSRMAHAKKQAEPTIWHENKDGHVSAYPFSCALRAGASYNYLLVDGERRLTEREMLRLQGFPESFKIVCNYSQTRKQAGNSVAVPVVHSVVASVLNALGHHAPTSHEASPSYRKQVSTPVEA